MPLLLPGGCTYSYSNLAPKWGTLGRRFCLVSIGKQPFRLVMACLANSWQLTGTISTVVSSIVQLCTRFGWFAGFVEMTHC